MVEATITVEDTITVEADITVEATIMVVHGTMTIGAGIQIEERNGVWPAWQPEQLSAQQLPILVHKIPLQLLFQKPIEISITNFNNRIRSLQTLISPIT